MYKTRQATERVLQLVEDGLLDRDTVIMACLKYMSEDDVADMAQANEFFYDDESDDEDDDE
jgi:hypothetical protein